MQMTLTSIFLLTAMFAVVFAVQSDRSFLANVLVVQLALYVWIWHLVVVLVPTKNSRALYCLFLGGLMPFTIVDHDLGRAHLIRLGYSIFDVWCLPTITAVAVPTISLYFYTRNSRKVSCRYFLVRTACEMSILTPIVSIGLFELSFALAN